MRNVLIASLITTLPALAQEGTTTSGGPGTPGTDVAGFQNYGTGCSGSGLSPGTPIVVPAAQAASFGNANNNIPFSWNPTRYQQVFLSSEIPNPAVLLGYELRQTMTTTGGAGGV